MAHPYWPVADLRLTSGDLTLRPMVEADLLPLADLKPTDVEMDPRLPVFSTDARTHGGTALSQSYWRALGTWRPDSWRLHFVVCVRGELAGVQDLEGENFAVLRTVETASWLGTPYRGRGIGKAMRRAVLALAFEGLDALVAHTEAWHDNAASLGVSRSLGYEDNGVGRHVRGDGADDMPRLRLTRETWLARHTPSGVRIDHLDACRHFFTG